MKFTLCSIRDRIAVVFDRPFCAVSTGAAIRSFGDAINNSDPSSPLALHPDHFDLFCLGTFNDEHATFDLLPHPLQLVTGSELVRNTAVRSAVLDPVPGPTAKPAM